MKPGIFYAGKARGGVHGQTRWESARSLVDQAGACSPGRVALVAVAMDSGLQRVTGAANSPGLFSGLSGSARVRAQHVVPERLERQEEMRAVVHMSDLEFGRENPRVVAGLKADLEQIRPSLVVVSGDVTCGAGPKQFQAAKAFLEGMAFPLVVVAGDRDVPLFNLWRRFVDPLRRYRRWITSELSPWFHDAEMAVLGITTARSLVWRRGRISYDQINHIKTRVCPIPDRKFKVVVTHHAFVPPPGAPRSGIDYLGRWRHAMEVLEMARVDLLLAGHLPRSQAGLVRSVDSIREGTFVAVQSGRALGRLGRGRRNAFQHLVLDEGRIVVAQRTWNGDRFVEAQRVTFELDGASWSETAVGDQ